MNTKLTDISFRIVTIDFIKKSKGNVANFKGRIEILVDDFDIVYDLKVYLSECYLDLCTTEAWFKTKQKNFKERQSLFKKLGYKQTPRCGPKKHNIVKLSKDQIEIVSRHFNSNKKNTLKNLITLIKGSNPSGEASNPDSAELLARIDNKLVPFSLLIKNLRVKSSERVFNVDSKKFDKEIKQLTFQEWIDNSDFLKTKHEILCTSKSPEEYKNTVKDFKVWVSRYTKYAIDVRNRISQSRARFKSNIDKYHKQKDILMIFNFDLREGYEFAHIKSVKEIKDEIKKELQKEETSTKNIDKLCLQISDHENFLPLPSRVHKIHDKNLIAYNLEGEINRISDKLEEELYLKICDQLKDHSLDKIPKHWYTKKRQYYVSEHWKHIKENR